MIFLEIFKLFGSILVDNKEANDSISKTESKADGLTSKLGKGIKTAAAWGAGMAAAAGIGLVAFIKAGDNLQNSLNDLQIKTGSSKDEMDGMKKSLENIYKGNYGESFNDIADSMALVKQNTGETGKALENTTKSALLLRDKFEFDVNETTRTAQSLMKQFGITSEQAFNLIAQGAQNGANKNGDLLDSLNEYAPQFKALGLSAEQFTNVLIDGAKNGQFSIDKVGDAVKEFNIRAKDGSKTTEDAFKSLGMNASKMGEKFAAGGATGAQAFKQVVTALNNVKDPVEKNRIGVELFGTQFEDLQAKGISALANIGNTANMSKDSLGEIDKIRYNSFGQALQGIGRNIMMGLFIPFEQKVMPSVNKFGQWIQDHMPQIKAVVSSTMSVVSKIFDGFKTVVGFVINNLNILLPIVVGLTSAFIAQMIIEKIIKFFKLWSEVTKTQTTLQWLLNLAMDANPLGMIALAIGAVIAAGILLYKNWDVIKAKLGQFWSYIKSIFGKIKSWILGVWDSIVGGIKGAINGVIRALNSMIHGLNKIHVKIPKWVPFFGGKDFGLHIPDIPMLAKGGNILDDGAVMVGERGPEILSGMKGAKVTPLDKVDNGGGVYEFHLTVPLDGEVIAQKTFRFTAQQLEEHNVSKGRGIGVRRPL